MSRGILFLAQNNSENYVRQACLCAWSIKTTNPEMSISIATNDFVPKKYKTLFDNIIEIPGDDLAANESWKVSNRCKLYDISPYNETIVLDTDMLVLSDISSWWKQLEKYELYFTSAPLTYRGEKLTSNFYRRTFVENNLPNIYVGVHYFKKSVKAKEFYDLQKTVVENWKEFYNQHITSKRPEYCSIDVCTSIVVKILDCFDQVTNKSSLYPTFVHMKPKAQNWTRQVSSWQEYVAAYISDDFEFKVGNYKQTGIFHYTENSFVDNILEQRIKELSK